MARTVEPSAARDRIASVVDANAEDLLRYFRRRVGEAEDAADLLARVLLILWEKCDRVPAVEADARLWCFGVARNVLREHYRRATRQLALAAELRDHLRTVSAEANAADRIVEADLQAAAVRRALALLGERSRELLILVHWDGFTLAEAARILSVNESTARTRHARALARLRAVLADEADSHLPDAAASRAAATSGT